MHTLTATQGGMQLVASGTSPEALRDSAESLELHRGQRIRVEVKLQVPVAQLANLSGINFLTREVWDRWLAPEDVRVDRVYAPDARTLLMEGTVTGTPLILIVIAIAGLLGSIALVINSIRVWVSGTPGGDNGDGFFDDLFPDLPEAQDVALILLAGIGLLLAIGLITRR